MKLKLKSLVAAGLVMPGLAYGQLGFTNVIEMVEMGHSDEPPLLWNMSGTIEAEGEGVDAGAYVPEAGAIFILSTIQASPFKDWFLDQAAVGAYMPQAELEIITHDTVSLKPRTRSDQPIRVNVDVSGLDESGDEDVQQAAKEVILSLFSESYPEGEFSLPGGEVSSAAHTQLSLEGNGEFPQSAGDLTFYTSLSPSAPDQAYGEEHFVVRSLSDGAIEGTALDQERVEVWPVWSSSQTGLQDEAFVPYEYSGVIPTVIGQVAGELEADETFQLVDGEVGYEEKPPRVVFNWYNRYPSSEVALIVNDASIPHPWGGRIIQGSRHYHNGDDPEDLDDLIYTHIEEHWEGLFSGQGRYAVWMVTKTPGIGWEVGGKTTAAGGLQPGGWVIPIMREGITVRASVQSLAE
ncbi:MAG: hypothetical protein ACSHYB_00930 [Roseibacillus sp.]